VSLRQGRRTSSTVSEALAGAPAPGSSPLPGGGPLPPALEAHVAAAYGADPGAAVTLTPPRRERPVRVLMP
jgi:hypothetical protein